MDTSGKVVIVTGAASGIGEALAEASLTAGAAGVGIVDRDGPGAEAVAERLGDRAIPVTCDVSERDQVAAAVSTVEDAFGPVSLFYSNAGIGDADDVTSPEESWQRAWDINLMSHVHASAEMVPRWTDAADGGHLVITASAAGLLMMPFCASYTVTKHASVGLAQWIAAHHGPAGVGVSVLCPQGVRTAMTSQFGDDGGPVGVDGMLDPDQVADHVLKGVADGRFLLLPHATVATHIQRKAADTDAWVAALTGLVAKMDDVSS